MNIITISPANNSSIDTELAMSLNHLCLQIQKEFDISPIALTQLINNASFFENCQFLYDQCYAEMNNCLRGFKEKYNFSGEIKHSISDGEYEKCGNIVKIYRNGYIEYCNLHQYLHPHPKIQLYKNKSDINHEFIIKNDDLIVNERYKFSIYVIYQNYVNKLHNLLKLLFYSFVNRSCKIQSIKIDSQNLQNLSDEMAQNPHIFKSKVIYEYINTVEDKQTKSDRSYYYLKVYRLDSVVI